MRLTKNCSCCTRQLSVEAFRTRWDKATPELNNHCRECEAAYRKARRVMARAEKPVAIKMDPGAIAAALMGWREAGAAFQGPRVRYGVAA